MNWHDTVFAFALFDMRSFSNIWFWIALATVWSVAGHWVLGVPISMVRRAARNDGQAQRDLENLVRIHARRLRLAGHAYGVWITGCACALLTALGVTGFFYQVEFAQALFLLVFPLSLTGALDMVISARGDLETLSGEPLRRHMWRHRNRVQMIGVVAILVTVIWGLRTIHLTGVFGG